MLAKIKVDDLSYHERTLIHRALWIIRMIPWTVWQVILKESNETR
jgi:hypothetical protein